MEVPWVCLRCGKDGRYLNSHVTHLRLSCADGSTTFSCAVNFCLYEFKKADTYYRHCRKHHQSLVQLQQARPTANNSNSIQLGDTTDPTNHHDDLNEVENSYGQRSAVVERVPQLFSESNAALFLLLLKEKYNLTQVC